MHIHRFTVILAPASEATGEGDLTKDKVVQIDTQKTVRLLAHPV